jgi:hypothetical protein
MVGSGMRCMQTCKGYTMIIGTAKTLRRLVTKLYSIYIRGRTPLPMVIIIQYEVVEYVITYWRVGNEGMTSTNLQIWWECLVLPHVQMEDVLTTYIKSTIWVAISFSSFESTPLDP